MAYGFGHITSIPSALTQLFAMYQAAYPMDANNEPVSFWFGAELPAWVASTTVEINGVHPANQEPASMSPAYEREETFSIDCRLTMFTGITPTSANFFSVMTNVWAAWTALEIAVANNPTLNGVVRFAEFGEMDYTPALDGKGMCMGTLTWAVRCSQRVYSLS